MLTAETPRPASFLQTLIGFKLSMALTILLNHFLPFKGPADSRCLYLFAMTVFSSAYSLFFLNVGMLAVLKSSFKLEERSCFLGINSSEAKVLKLCLKFTWSSQFLNMSRALSLAWEVTKLSGDIKEQPWNKSVFCSISHRLCASQLSVLKIRHSWRFRKWNALRQTAALRWEHASFPLPITTQRRSKEESFHSARWSRLLPTQLAPVLECCLPATSLRRSQALIKCLTGQKYEKLNKKKCSSIVFSQDPPSQVKQRPDALHTSASWTLVDKAQLSARWRKDHAYTGSSPHSPSRQKREG